MVRQCRDQWVRFYRDDDRLCLVRWYRVPPDTPFVPHLRNWVAEEWDEDPGPQIPLGPQPFPVPAWNDGLPSRLYRGDAPCGTEEQWRRGQALPPDPPTPVDGLVPACCGLPAQPRPPDECLFPKFIQLSRDSSNPTNPYWSPYHWLCQYAVNHWRTDPEVLPGQGFTNWDMAVNAPFQPTIMYLVQSVFPFSILAEYTMAAPPPPDSPYNYPLVWSKVYGLPDLPDTVTVWPGFVVTDQYPLATDLGQLLLTNGSVWIEQAK